MAVEYRLERWPKAWGRRGGVVARGVGAGEVEILGGVNGVGTRGVGALVGVTSSEGGIADDSRSATDASGFFLIVLIKGKFGQDVGHFLVK